MKKYLFTTLAAVTLMAAACTPQDAPKIEVTGVTLDATQIYLAVGDPQHKLTATVAPDDATNTNLLWRSDNEAVATVTDGMVKPLANGTAIITVQAQNGGYTQTCTVTVDLLGACTFATTGLWTIFGATYTQTWSDAVVASGAVNKTTYAGGSSGDYKADWRSNPGYSGSLFSWEAVNQYKTRLCPAPWRVPTKQDFIDLDVALGGNGVFQTDGMLRNRYLYSWGGAYGGYCTATNWLGDQGSQAYYWSQTAVDADDGAIMNFRDSGVVVPQGITYGKGFSFTVRCVKNE